MGLTNFTLGAVQPFGQPTLLPGIQSPAFEFQDACFDVASINSNGGVFGPAGLQQSLIIQEAGVWLIKGNINYIDTAGGIIPIMWSWGIQRSPAAPLERFWISTTTIHKDSDFTVQCRLPVGGLFIIANMTATIATSICQISQWMKRLYR